jgi:hypothetical protein
MNMQPIKRTALLVLAFAFIHTAADQAVAQSDQYTEGAVINVSDIRTLPGQFNNYMNYIFGDYARLMEAYKEEGIILNWGVYVTQPSTPDGPNVILTTAYPNMAAFDNMQERMNPIVQRVLNWTPDQGEARFAERERMRTTLGSKLLRHLNPIE